MSVNKIEKIKNSNINNINQTNIEKQEININVINGDNDGYLKMVKSHDLFPYYIVNYKQLKNGKYALVSQPTCKESLTKYPPNYKSSCTVIDERYKNIKDKEQLIDILYYTDTPIEIKINNTIQYLGNTIDPYPNPDINLKGKGIKTYIIPVERKLPNFTLNVCFKFKDSKFMLNNINLKLVKRFSNKAILNNYHQKSSIVLVEFEMSFKSKNVISKFKYRINELKSNNSKAVLIYNKFVLNLIMYDSYIYETGTNSLLANGTANSKINKVSLDSLKNYIENIENVILIEKYFNIDFEIPNIITNEDSKIIFELSNYIKSTKRKINSSIMRFSLIKKYMCVNQVKELILKSRVSMISTIENINYNIFGKEIYIKKILDRYEDMKCNNIDEVNEFLDNYDTFNQNEVLTIYMCPYKGKYIKRFTEIII